MPKRIRRRTLLAAAGGLAAVIAATVMLASGGQSADSGQATVVRQGSADMIIPAASNTVPSNTVPPNTVPTAGVPSDPASSPASGLAGGTPTHLVVPDVIASVPRGVAAADLARLRQIAGVRSVLAIDGARITVNGTLMTVLAAPAAALRPWTPPATAASAAVWSAFQAGDLITTAQAADTAHLAAGIDYPVVAAVQEFITAGGTALLGVTGIDGVVSQAEGSKLGLVKNVAVLVNAPADDVTALVAQVRAALGASSRVVPLVAAATTASLPVDTAPPAGRPANYLQLFEESAARYCPGLSWTVLAAIAQIESADGQNVGPSTAGALGPMQFLPSTWAQWGIDGFGDTGAPDIMNPFDAVPSAARMLCADGAASGTTGLRQAIFDYNHADWYVDEVLTLAAEYAREY